MYINLGIFSVDFRGSGMSTRQEISIEELVEKYRKARKVRRMYAIKAFFKIKRGAIGVGILVLLTALSLLSPWIAPEPNKFRHAPYSKPGWMKIFDPNAIGDFNLTEHSFTSQEEISESLDPSQVGIDKLYVHEDIEKIGTMTYNGLRLEEHDGYFDASCAVLEITDNTSLKPITVGKKSVNATFGFNIKLKWDKNVPPYAAYLWFAHRFVIGIKPLLNETVRLTQGQKKTFRLDLSEYFNRSLSGVRIHIANLSEFDPEKGDQLKLTIESGPLKDTRILKKEFSEIYTISNYTEITVENLGRRAIEILVEITVESGQIYPLTMNLYLNLWNSDENREYTKDELREYLREFQIVPPEEELSDRGLLIHKDISRSSKWVTFGHPIRTYLTGREIYQEPFFQKDNIIIVKIEVSISINPLYAKLRRMFGKTIPIKWYIDNIVVEIQDKYYGLMGTDKDGADIFAKIVDGLKISLLVGFTATFANIAVGVTLGLVSGYMGGKIDEVIMRIVDFFMSIPGLPLLMVLAFVFYSMNVDPLIAIIVVLSIFGWAGMARTIRSQVLALRANIYVEAAKASGASSFYIIRKHILPGVWALCLLYLMVGVVGNILAEAGLSFLGILRPNWNSLGKMIQEAAGISAATGGGAAGLTMRAIHWIFFPGFVLMLIGFAFYAIGDAYDELINPKRRKRF